MRNCGVEIEVRSPRHHFPTRHGDSVSTRKSVTSRSSIYNFDLARGNNLT